jgi:serine/threonine protein kinase
VYDTPASSAVPASLRGLLLDRGLDVSLSSIVRIAKGLIRSVSFIHTSTFVHKNIRPENVLVFPSDDASVGMSFLVGFNQFRHAQQQTSLLGDPAWHRNLYRHPERQGTNVLNRYVMQHDIYSLGVCLLEIGLWQSFVHYPGLNPNALPCAPVSSEIQISDQDFEAAHLSARLRIKEQLEGLATRKLPSRIGDVYTEVVLACLRCLDPGNRVFGDKNENDKNGTIIGVRFIELILARINSISI